jgi:hypothetical protein
VLVKDGFEARIVVKMLMKKAFIKDKPRKNIGSDEVFYFEVVIVVSFAEVIENELLERFGVGFCQRHHFAACGSFGFKKDAHLIFGSFAEMDNEVFFAFGIHFIMRGIENRKRCFFDVLRFLYVCSSRAQKGY